MKKFFPRGRALKHEGLPEPGASRFVSTSSLTPFSTSWSLSSWWRRRGEEGRLEHSLVCVCVCVCVSRLYNYTLGAAVNWKSNCCLPSAVVPNVEDRRCDQDNGNAQGQGNDQPYIPRNSSICGTNQTKLRIFTERGGLEATLEPRCVCYYT